MRQEQVPPGIFLVPAVYSSGLSMLLSPNVTGSSAIVQLFSPQQYFIFLLFITSKVICMRGYFYLQEAVII